MNQQRRKALSEIRDEIESLVERAEEARDEEQEYFDNMPESFQMGEKGDAASEALAQLETAIDALNEAMNAIEEAQA